MRRGFSATVLALLIGLGCGDDSGSNPFEPAVPVTPGSGQNDEAVVIDFEGFPAGQILDGIELEEGGTLSIEGRSAGLTPGTNGAIVFDSSEPGPDRDLGTPNEDFGGPGVGEGGERGAVFQNDRPLGNLLIVAQNLTDADGDGLVDVPNDASGAGQALEFDFSGVGSGTVTVETITIVDIDRTEPRAVVELRDAQGGRLAAFSLPDVGDNGVGTFSLGPTEEVAEMIVVLDGSGAIDEVTFTP